MLSRTSFIVQGCFGYLHNIHKQHKISGVTLTKQAKDLYDNNFKSLKKEIEEDILNGKISHSKINIVKMAILLKQIERFMQSSSKSQKNSLQTLKEQVPTLYGKRKNHRIAKMTLLCHFWVQVYCVFHILPQEIHLPNICKHSLRTGDKILFKRLHPLLLGVHYGKSPLPGLAKSCDDLRCECDPPMCLILRLWLGKIRISSQGSIDTQ